MVKTLRLVVEGHPPVSVRPTDSVRHAVRAMYEAKVGAVTVVDGEGLHGIFTERDALRFFALTRRNPYVVDVEAVMSAPPVTMAADTPVSAARSLMLTRGFRHLPVLDGDRLIGVVSLRGLDGDLDGGSLPDDEIAPP